MQAIAFPEIISTETVRRTLLEVAWHLLHNHELTSDSFVEMITLNAPTSNGAALFVAAVRKALIEEAVSLARQLTERGLQLYPADAELVHYQQVLAAPKVISRSPAKHNFSKTMRWLSAHSHEYLDRWIAVQDGVLLGQESTRTALVEQLGDIAEGEDVLITRVPST